MQHYHTNEDQAQQYEPFFNYDVPNRRSELLDLEAAMRSALSRKDVLEITNGTRYWTDRMAPIVNRITSVNMSCAAQQAADSKLLFADNAPFGHESAGELNRVPGVFNSGMASFWFSCIPIQYIPCFLDQFHKRLDHGAIVFVADNVYSTNHNGGELIQQSVEQQLYRFPTLCGGSKYEMLHDYYLEDQLLEYFGPYTHELRIHIGETIWWLTYQAHACPAGR